MPEIIIIENGELLQVSPERGESLINAGLIYSCDECGGGVHHIFEGRTWEEVEDHA